MPGQDKIDLRPLDADPTRARNQQFRVVEAFTSAAGEVRLVHTTSGDILVQADGDRDAAVDMTIRIVGVHLTDTDLIH